MPYSKYFSEREKIFCDKTQKKSMDYVRDNLYSYLHQHNMSVADFAEKADISVYTLNSILRNDDKRNEDCKLSTIILIAKAMGIGVDELANTGAAPRAVECLKLIRTLPPHLVDLIIRYIKWQSDKYEKSKNYPNKVIDVMNLDYVDAHLRATDHFEKVDISECDRDIKSIVFRGMRLPCDDYYQYYQEGDILLLSSIREPKARERCVISYYGRLFIVQKDRKNGVSGYRGIRDEEAFIPASDIDHYFGYVAGVKHD